MTDAIRDGNYVPVALGVSSSSATTTLPFKVNPSTGGLLTEAASATFTTSTITAASVTLDSSYVTVLCDCTANAITVNLPAATTASGRIYNIKKVDATANTVTIDASGAETIDGTATKSTSTQYVNFQIQSNGTAWYVL